MTRPHKFNARRVTVEGEVFDSRFEANCWLVLRKAAKEFPFHVTRQVEWLLIPAQSLPSGRKEKQAVFTADFVLSRFPVSMEGIGGSSRHWSCVIEAKSEATAKEPDYVLRRKLLYHAHKIEVTEVKSIAELERLLEALAVTWKQKGKAS